MRFEEETTMINRVETDNVIEVVEDYFNEIVSGSGFDYSWEVREGYKKDNTIYIKSYYHLMNDNGYYVGNTPIEIKAITEDIIAPAVLIFSSTIVAIAVPEIINIIQMPSTILYNHSGVECMESTIIRGYHGAHNE